MKTRLPVLPERKGFSTVNKPWFFDELCCFGRHSECLYIVIHLKLGLIVY